MAREIFKLNILFVSLLIFASARLSDKDLIDNGFSCENNVCKLSTLNTSVSYFFNDKSINVNATAEDVKDVIHYCDIAFKKLLNSTDSNKAKDMLSTRVKDHNNYLDENLIFILKPSIPILYQQESLIMVKMYKYLVI